MIYSLNEFHISKKIRDLCSFDETLFSSSGNVILANISAVRTFQIKFNKYLKKNNLTQISAGTLNAMGLLDEIFHLACYTYRRHKNHGAFKNLLKQLEDKFGKNQIDSLLVQFCKEFPPVAVYKGECSIEEYLSTELTERKTGRTRTNREQTLEEMIMLCLDNENPAFKPFSPLFDDSGLRKNPVFEDFWKETQNYFKSLPQFGTFGNDLISFLREPVRFAPDNLQEQLNYVRTHWAELFLPGDGEGEDYWLKRLFGGSDLLSEEWKPEWHPTNGGSPDMSPPNYDYLMKEYERFSADREWMPRVVLLAKTVLVWLFQLSKKYSREISRLDQIPDEELDTLRDEGFTGLWLIGLWERSQASKRIKQMCGNPEAAASAYSLEDYEIASNLGGWDALANLRTRLWKRGIRLASDMVPNHTGMDSKWVVEKPDLFIQRRDNPFPQYTFNGPNLSHDGRVAIYLEDHYYSKSDCAVVFKRIDTATGDTRYIYHGNDGTGMPWNDTAQIDFLNPKAREEVMQEILHVARNFPIIRFDAAMVLAKKHIKRLWYPEPGKGGDIATRSQFALSAEEFEKKIPNEFWREVVDRVAKEVPDTLLLAEAFWMMEGYFTRTLGMHRVYNSAFMNMLKKEENYKYRQTVKNTIQFDPQILKRYVNFMNNPDEETAVAQFGKGDKYFGVCTLMVTMPGLPMFGHGQIEGFEEKYGMEYTRAYRDEQPDQYLIERHKREIFPLMKKRYIFAGVEDFLFYDVWNNGSVNENVFAYSNKCGSEYSLVFYNNKYERASGWIKQSCEYAVKTGSGENDKKLVSRSISEGLRLWGEDDFYMIFREQRSNLWYIRKSKDICEHGMFIALNGFETQIFLDIRQEKDADGSLAEICSFLNGRGTPDLKIAWQELHYKNLYIALEKLVSPVIKAEAALISKAQDEKAKAEEQLEEKLIAKLAEKDKNASARQKKSDRTSEDKAAKPCARQLSSAEFKSLVSESALEELYKTADKFAEEEFEEDMRRTELAADEHEEEKDKKTLKPSKKSKNQAFKPFHLPKIALPKDAAKEASENSLNLMILSLVLPLAEKGKAACWGLSRKISEFAANENKEVKKQILDTNKISVWLEKSFALLETKNLEFNEKSAEEDEKKLASRLVSSKYSWLLTGANEYGGVKWFNAEKMAEILKQGKEIFSLGKSDEKNAQVLKLFKKLDSAQKKSEYKCENFLKTFEKEPAKKKETKNNKKNANKKAR